MQRKSIATLLLTLIVLSICIITVAAEQQNQLKVNRYIQIFPGFIVVQDNVEIKGQISNLTIYLTPEEYKSLYSLQTNPKYPIQWGAIKDDYLGFRIPINGFEGNITITRVYDQRIFNQIQSGVKTDMFAYLMTDLPISTVTTKVKFSFPPTNIIISSPKNAIQKYENGTYYIYYNSTALSPYNTTLFTLSFNPPNDLPWVKINSLTRNIIIDNLEKVKIIDTFIIEYIGFNQTVRTWIPYILPDASIISVRDDFGNLSYTNNAVSLRYPLFSTIYTNAYLNYTRAKIIITSEIDINKIGSVNGNQQQINLSFNPLQSNFYIIDNFTLIITIKYLVNAELYPIPDKLVTQQDGNEYIYYLSNVYPNYNFNISLKTTINPFIYSLNSVNQILVIIIILLFFVFIYTRYSRRPVLEKIVAIPEIPKFINLIESLILDYEEIEQLDLRLDKGLIKKHDYTARLNNLRREIENKENELKKISNFLITKYPETKSIISDINLEYSKLVKARNALKETRNSHKMKKIQPEMYKRMVEIHSKTLKESKTKIDSLLNQLKGKYLRK
jgi:hypothetical protein